MRARRLAFVALVVALATVAVVGADDESHQTSVRYLAWLVTQASIIT